MAVSIDSTRAGQTLTDQETIAPLVFVTADAGSSWTDIARLLAMEGTLRDSVGTSVVLPAPITVWRTHHRGDLVPR
jgi:hypothetical protein